jgi:GNAT superfamily N-acetyltransferase
LPFPAVARATADQAPTLTAIALAAKRHWGYPERWLEAWTADLTVTAQYLASHPCYAAVHDGEAVGFHALVMAAGEPRARLDHLWVRPDWIGRGLGRVLFQHAMATAAAAGASHVWFDAEPHAEPFYLHMGARRIGERRGQVEGQPRLLPVMEIVVRRPAAGRGGRRA